MVVDKEILIDILYKDAKHGILLLRLQKIGLDFDGISIELLDNVLDLIGYPKNTREPYDKYYVQKENHFSREYLHSQFFDKVISLHNVNYNSEYEIINGISISKDESIEIKERIVEFIDWLYKDFYRITKVQ